MITHVVSVILDPVNRIGIDNGDNDPVYARILPSKSLASESEATWEGNRKRRLRTTP